MSTDPAPAPLRRLARRRPLVVAPTTTLRELTDALSQGREDAAVVADVESHLPLGIITLRQLLHSIGFERASLDEPVAMRMVGAPLTLAADAPLHRAKVLMAKRGVRHLLLVEPDGRLAGLVGQAELLGIGADETEALIVEIAAARDLDAMVLAADRVRRRGAELFHSGLSVEALCQWMSGLNDLIGMRICELIEDEHELPAVPWCWLVFGSEGRLEQTFATDQDNGLLFVPPTPAATDECRMAFLPFAQAVNTALHHCGFPRCPGRIMAGNPDWCLSLGEWRQRFGDWLRVPEPEALLHGTIFFDFRPLYGNAEPADQLRAWLAETAPDHARFFRALAEQTLAVAPPIGLGGRLRAQRDPDYPGRIDLKQRGARLFTDPARLWGLQLGSWATNTAERLRTAAAAQQQPGADTAAEVEAFHLIQRFRIGQQLATNGDHDTANLIDPRALSPLHRLMLKEALRQAKTLQLRLRQQFQV